MKSVKETKLLQNENGKYVNRYLCQFEVSYIKFSLGTAELKRQDGEKGGGASAP